MQLLHVPKPAEERTQHSSRFRVLQVFRRDYEHYKGVLGINIYLLQLLYSLVFLFVSYDSWNHILNHTGKWNPGQAAALVYVGLLLGPFL